MSETGDLLDTYVDVWTISIFEQPLHFKVHIIVRSLFAVGFVTWR